jgi:hypothetical protein
MPNRTRPKFTSMDNLNFDELLKTYKETVDHWVDAIRAEEALATNDHGCKGIVR